MPFTHHSHSGQFCGHATSNLEEIVLAALSQRMSTLCLTEHIPRDRLDFYPEEESAGHTESSLAALFDAYYAEARRLQAAYADRITIFVGFEGEWIRAPRSEAIIDGLLERYPFDLFVGSVHHVHTFPIDYDGALYGLARDAAGGTDEKLFEDYFDAQLAMLQALRPPVVGHFDLIRLKSEDPDRGLRTYGDGVWGRVERNLRFVAGYGGVVEVNGSALRKGLGEAYPQGEVLRTFRGMGGRVTLSDDSHGVEQVGLGFKRVVELLREAGVEEVVCLAGAGEVGGEAHDVRFPVVRWRTVRMEEAEAHAFFKGR